jgi:uncharacterized membrane protein YbhN (UPF0104 family)
MFPEKVSYWTAFCAQSIGMFGNNVLPLKLGDVVRVVLFQRLSSVSAAASICTVALGYVLATVAFVIVFISLSPTLRLPAPVTRWFMLSVYIVAVLACLIVIAYVVLRRSRHRIIMPRQLSQIIFPLVPTFKVLALRRSLLLVLTTGLYVVVSSLATWSILKNFFSNATLSTAFLVTSSVCLSQALPSAPGSIGPFHLAAILSLGYSLMPDESSGNSVAAAVLLHGTLYAVVSLAGLISFFWLVWEKRALLKSLKQVLKRRVMGNDKAYTQS